MLFASLQEIFQHIITAFLGNWMALITHAVKFTDSKSIQRYLGY